MLGMYDYPVMITDEDVKNYLYADADREALNTAHEIVYDFLIYPTFNADIKNRVIEKYREELEKPIKRALLAQYKYLAGSGDASAWNGLIGGEQSVDAKEQQEILTRVLAPKVINILKGAPVDILYAGG